MKKIMLAIMLMLMSVPLMAQSTRTVIQTEEVKWQSVFTADTTLSTQYIDITNMGVVSHAFSYTPAGAITGLTVTVTASSDGVTYAAPSGCASSCASTNGGDTITWAGTFQRIKVVMTGLTVSSPSINATYTGGTAVGYAKTGGGGASTYVAYFTAPGVLSGDSSLTYPANGGPLTVTGNIISTNTIQAGVLIRPAADNGASIGANTAVFSQISGYSFNVPSGGSIGFSNSATNPNTLDVILRRDAANTLAQRNGPNAQTFRVYNTFTDASNNEYVAIDWTATSNIASIQTVKNGSGTVRALGLGINGSNAWLLETSNANFIPRVDSAVSIGDATHRLSNLYSVLGTFGVATNAPAHDIYVGSNAGATLTMDGIQSVTNPEIDLRSANGTQASRTTVTANANVGGIRIWGYDGAAYQEVSRIASASTGSISAGVVPGNLVLWTSNPSGVLTTAITINSSQFSTFAGGVTVNSASSTGNLNVTGTIYLAGLTAEGGTKSAVCWDSATSQLESNAAATCTVSNLGLKDYIGDISSADALHIINSMRPAIFQDKDGKDGQRFGFAAEWADLVDKRLVYYENGKPHAIDYERYSAVLTTYVQDLQRQIDDLKRRQN